MVLAILHGNGWTKEEDGKKCNLGHRELRKKKIVSSQ